MARETWRRRLRAGKASESISFRLSGAEKAIFYEMCSGTGTTPSDWLRARVRAAIVDWRS